MASLIRVALSYLVLGILMPGSVAAQDSKLASQVQAILKSRCADCHSDGVNEGGFGYALSRRRLVRQTNGLVVPGSPDDSLLYEQIQDDKMPQGDDPLTAAEKDTVRRWIAAGAPDWNPNQKAAEFIPPQKMLGYMQADLKQAAPRDRRFLRYLTITHLKNAGFSEDELQSYRNGLSKLINSLSWGRKIQVPQPVDPHKTVLRIDLRHYKWNENGAWRWLLSFYPYRLIYSFPAARFCYDQTGSPLPHLRGDWFVAAATRPPLYHFILGIPQNDWTLEKRLNVDVPQNIHDALTVRAGFYPSGISQSNRLIEWHESSYGSYWKSYDFAGNKGRQNLRSYPLGPGGGNRSFRHDGGEILFSLPNGLQGYMLTDGYGRRIDTGPTQVVVDKLAVQAGRNPEVINGVSCMRCHWKGVIRKKDQIRSHVLGNSDAFTAKEVDTVKALYPPAKRLEEVLTESENQFAKAVKECGAPLSRTEPVAMLSEQFLQPLDLALAAAEAQVTVEDFQKALKRDPLVARALGVPISRGTYMRTFGRLIRAVNLGEFVPRKADPGAKPLLTNSIGMKLKLIPAGEFHMGSPEIEEGRGEDEYRHLVRISTPFYMGQHEVTIGEFRRFVAATSHRTSAEKSDKGGHGWNASKRKFEFQKEFSWKDLGFPQTDAHPVANVSWIDAVAFCKWLSKKEGVRYRLPTEAEWEYACRGGSWTRFSFGDSDEPLPAFGNVADFSAKSKWGANYPGFTFFDGQDGFSFASPVGSLKPNGFGLYDMHGNVWEHCSDWYDKHYYRASAVFDPFGPKLGITRVRRGGGWGLPSQFSRSALRRWSAPDFCSTGVGFRIVRSAVK